MLKHNTFATTLCALFQHSNYYQVNICLVFWCCQSVQRCVYVLCIMELNAEKKKIVSQKVSSNIPFFYRKCDFKKQQCNAVTLKVSHFLFVDSNDKMSEQQAEAGSAHHRYKSTINKRMNRDVYENLIESRYIMLHWLIILEPQMI